MPRPHLPFPDRGAQLAIFGGCFCAGVVFNHFQGAWTLHEALVVWSWLESPLVDWGWIAPMRSTAIPGPLDPYPLIDVCASWLTALLVVTGLLNLVLLCLNRKQRVTLALPSEWIRYGHLHAIWVTWALAIAIAPGVYISLRWFT